MSARAIKINIVSFNLANTTKDLAADPTEVLQYNPDIHVEATQEDQRKLDTHSIFGSALANRGYTLFDMISLNQKPTDMNVVLRVFMKADLLGLQGMTEHKKGKEPLPELNGLVGKSVLKAQAYASRLSFGNKGFSKGATWIKIYQPFPVLFINMHLPILKTKGNRGLGFAFRAQKLKEILTHPGVKALATADTTVFITGDLNFRINPDQHDQLTDLIAQDIPFLKELPFLRPEDRVITCKFEKDKGEACKEARKLQPVVPGGPPMPAGMDYCVSEKRTPSRCDRILFHSGDGMSVRVLQHKGADLVDSSDHNALFATVELNYGRPSNLNVPEYGIFTNHGLANQSTNVSSNEEIARVAQEEQSRKQGLGGLFVANNNVGRTRKRKQSRRKTRKA
jgi:hypothetical protein